jgi:hypothetical protein
MVKRSEGRCDTTITTTKKKRVRQDLRAQIFPDAREMVEKSR